ncbi:unnamed protein product [Cylicocyclus nassatus]|uniref:receptor protein-tyrosine kinase n=1 Tax=Cylicocyclus nassatus TaxID=53992 RepID=A0AA36DPW5_CYLNA|nr:unnamed protein product [Cylicocyclus nassatus]
MRDVLFIIICIFCVCDRNEATVFSNSLKTCQLYCSERNLAFPLARGKFSWDQEELAKCDYSCRVNSCHHGCRDLDEPLSKCESRCNAEDVAFDSCFQGCYAVEHAFLVQAQELLYQVTVTIDALGGSLRLRWQFPESVQAEVQEVAAADVGWYAQTRPSGEKKGWKWSPLPVTAFRNATLASEVSIPLEPTSQLQVRLALVYRSRVGVSRIITYQMPLRVVPSRIELTSQLQLSSDKVAICWKGEPSMVQFKVSLATLDGNPLFTDTTDKRCYLLEKLAKENCCRATIMDVTTEEQGHSASVKLDLVQPTATPSEESGQTSSRLVFSTGSKLFQMRSADNYIVSEEELLTIPFEIPEGDSITSLEGVSSTSLVVGSSRGSVWLLSLEYNDTVVSTTPTVIRQPDEASSDEGGHPVTQIKYDFMQNAIYVALSDKGIARCTLENPSCFLLANTDSSNIRKNIAVDSVNGFLYFLNEHQVYRTELFPFDVVENYQISNVVPITDIPPTLAIELDDEKFQLLAALENGTILAKNLISGRLAVKRNGEFPTVKRLLIDRDRLFWLREKCGDSPQDEMCFYSEYTQKDGSETHFIRYFYSGKLVDFTILSDPTLPPTLTPPEKIGLIMSDTKAKVSWIPPANLPFQASSNDWRNISYEVRLITQDTPNTPVAGKISNETSVTMAVIPGAEYTASVRVCWNSVCSSFVNVINSAFIPFKYQPLAFLRRSNELTSVLDVLGEDMQGEHIIKVFQPCCDGIMSFDNTTQTFYNVDSSEGSIVFHRVPEPNEVYIFTSYLTLKFITVLASRAMLVLASSYQIISYRLTGAVEHVIYSCSHAIDDCAEIIGLSSDDQTGEIHFLAQYPNGTMALFELNQEDRTPHLLSTSTDLPAIRQLLVTNEKVIFVTQKGRVGQCDKKLGSLNLNYALSEVGTVIPLNPEAGSNRVEVQVDSIIMNELKKDELSWVVEPRQEPGMVLYKVSLYKEKLVGDAHTAVTTMTKLTLPTELLQSWSSAQKFDANIAAINAWMSVNTSKTGLQAPLKPPTVPTNVRLYATQQRTVDGARAIISLFWSPPTEWNAAPFQYLINCTKDDGTSEAKPVPATTTHYSFEMKSGKVDCSVAAANERNNVGEYTAKVSIDSSELRPLVRLFAIDSTNELIAITNVTQDEPTKHRVVSNMEYQAIAFIGDDLFAVRKEHDSLQPVLLQIDTNDINTFKRKASIGGDVSRVDALTSDWVGNRLLLVSGQALYQLVLDDFKDSSSSLMPRKLIDLTTGATDAKLLTFDPFKNTAYLLTKNGSLFSLNLSRSHEKNLALASSPKIYALTWNGLVMIDVEENNKCNEVRIDWNKFGGRGLRAMSAFAIADKVFVFVTSSEMLIYGKEVTIPIEFPPLRQILAVSQSSQPYPDRSCFILPSSAGIQFNVANEGKTGAFVEMSKPPPTNVCHGISLPQTCYDVYFTRKNSDKKRQFRNCMDKMHVENGVLDKETDYEVKVAWSNRYSDITDFSEAKPFRTGFGYPSAPRGVQAVAVTPDTVYLYWNLPETLNAPISEIKYKVLQQASTLSSPSTIAVREYMDGNFSPNTSDSASCLISPCQVKLPDLRPGTDYKFWVQAIHKSHLNSQFEEPDALSQEASARTKDIPGTLKPDNVTGSSLLLRWNSLQAEQLPNSISVQYKETASTGKWKTPSNASFDPSLTTILVRINGLLSATSYDYRFVANYSGTYTIESKPIPFEESYYQAVKQQKTKAGVPTAPLHVEARMDDEGWIVSWKGPSSDGGSPITSYAVEMRHNRSSEWEIGERGLDAWRVWWRPAKSDRRNWEFRVRATNAEGFGAYGYSSDNAAPPTIEQSTQSWLYVVLFVSLIAIIVLLSLIFLMMRARTRAARLKKERTQDKNCITLEKIAGLHSAPYQPMPPEMLNEIKNLPHVRSDYIRLEKKLGTGSFGEVWEGVATKLPMRDRETKVAIKTLRQGYEEAEKIKFIKEAILMNNFDHPNIVKLLGVCMEGPKEYLILELMEGGDLLNFLKASSPTESFPSQLSLRDVLSMLVDIGRGGAYLESNRHVHRDLAARNCLISSKSPHPRRVTKIGALHFPPEQNDADPDEADFGLARGVYNSEYYKVRGEDFLPLRWLAPECISKGVFSSKSDVWAFGILMYEIVGMGQKPYHNMDNNQVLVHVKNGGTPAKPAYCPDQLYKIMQLCWAYEKEQRPTFADILTMFEKLRDKSEFQDEKPFPPCSGHYDNAFDLSQDSTSSEKMGSEKGVSNQAFCDVERLSEQNRFDKSSNGNASTRKAMPTLVRSLRKENKAKPSPPPSLADLDARIQSSSATATIPSLSNETLTTSCDYGSSYQSPSFASSSRSPLVLASNLSAYEMPKKSSLTVESEHADDSPHSRSWAGPQSRNRVNQSQAFAFSIHPSQSDANTPQVTTRKNRTPLPTPSSSYDSRRKSRVSQV